MGTQCRAQQGRSHDVEVAIFSHRVFRPDQLTSMSVSTRGEA
jgi:hypothetical protein